MPASMQAAQTPASKVRFVTPDKESSIMINTLWQEEVFDQICSRESLTEKAAENEKTMSVKEQSMVVQSARIACFRGISILFPSSGGSKFLNII